MKIYFLFILFSFLSCQKNESSSPVINQAEKVVSIEEDLGSFKFDSNIQGLEIIGEGISREGDLIVSENLKIVETSTSKVIDAYSMKEWGKVGFKLDQNIIHVYPLKNSFELIYSVREKKVHRQGTCTFKTVNSSHHINENRT